MDTIPTEFYGLPGGILIMAAVEAMKSAGLPEAYAGLTAIALATIVGAAFLVTIGHQPWAEAVMKGFLFGLSVWAAHHSIVRPVSTAVRGQ